MTVEPPASCGASSLGYAERRNRCSTAWSPVSSYVFAKLIHDRQWRVASVGIGHDVTNLRFPISCQKLACGFHAGPASDRAWSASFPRRFIACRIGQEWRRGTMKCLAIVVLWLCEARGWIRKFPGPVIRRNSPSREASTRPRRTILERPRNSVSIQRALPWKDHLSRSSLFPGSSVMAYPTDRYG